jgi:hypothetical protein
MKTFKDLMWRQAAAIAMGLGLAARVSASSGTEGAAFLDIPVGGGPAAMGSAYTAMAADAYAPTYNPAGLGFVESNEVAGQHLSYLESMRYEYLSFVHPFGQHRDAQRGIGMSIQHFASGDIQGMNEAGEETGDFSSTYGSYNLAYGQRFGENLSLGLTGKLIHAKIEDYSANAYAADLGGMYRMSEKLSLAGSLTNVGTKLKFDEEGDPLPMALHAAAAFQATPHVTLALEGVYRRNGLASAHTGISWRPLEALSLRAGYRTDTLKGLSPLAGLTTGVGIHVFGQEFAYAWLPYGDLGSTQYFSLVARFGQREDSKRQLIKYQTIKKHRSVNGKKSDKMEDPEYQQLMQMLSGHDEAVVSR